MFVAITTILCLRSVTAYNYFHETSEISLKPLKDQASFGFSLGYQGGTSPSIVTGAPHCDLIGKVFRCPMKNWFVTNKCDDVDIDVDNLAPYDRERAPNLKLNLGVSIAATSDYFMTCAPLWPANEKLFTYGTCFTYNGTAHRYNGILEKHNKGNPKKFKNTKLIYGGTGWKTLVDEKNDLLLVAKVVLRGDIVSVNASNPLAQVKSLVKYNDVAKNYLSKFRNIGTSMAAGRFFKGDETVYAISATTPTVFGTIHFLKSLNNGLMTLSLMSALYKKYVKIEDTTVGSMFGAAMASADFNDDGLSELLVGAPVEGDGERGYENGAIHIYLGGDMKKINDESRHRVIMGSEDGSRFGTAIASSDVDGDNTPEIFVSAPYESSGAGAVYILSGSEVYTLISSDHFKKISLSELKLTQKIHHTEFKTFGFSMQSIPDINDNGCDELAVGAPGSNEVVLLRCIPAVKVDIQAELAGELIVREQDSNFTVTICVSAQHLKGKKTTIDLKFNDEVIGNGASIDNHQRTLSLEVFGPEPTVNCTDVTVHLSDNEPGEYRFSTELQLDEGIIMNSEDFKSSWSVLSPLSVNKTSVEVSRHCSGKDCDPDLFMDIKWSGSPTSNYSLGSSDSLTTKLVVKNSGHSSYDSCVLVKTSGAPVDQIGCVDHNDGYKCFLPKPLRRNAEHEIPIIFNMSHPTNLERELRVQAYLYDVCSLNKTSKEQELIIPYYFDDKQVTLNGSSHNQTISDVKIQDQALDTINDAQEYWVVNEGPVLWKNISASITIDIQPFITTYRVSPKKGCIASETANSTSNSTVNILILCTIDVPPRYSTKFIVSTVISKDLLVESLVHKKMEVTSRFRLQMIENGDTKEIRLATVFTWQKERSLGQNQSLIIILAVFGAVIALAVLIFVLYKMEFFKRRGKTKLENLKHEHSIRRQSIVIKRSISESNESNERADYANDGLEMEIEDDSPFEIVDMADPVLKQDTK